LELLDRERERAALDELVDAAGRGRGGAVVIRGEPGVGLSTLVAHAVDRGAAMRVARIRGASTERGIHFAAPHQLCAPMLDRLDEIPMRQRGQPRGGVRPDRVGRAGRHRDPRDRLRAVPRG
jgi:hypothetical protein